MESRFVSAIEMARGVGVDPKEYRKALRAENFSWHRHNDRWTVDRDSDRHADMERVLRGLLQR